jgi:hypothetical protein
MRPRSAACLVANLVERGHQNSDLRCRGNARRQLSRYGKLWLQIPYSVELQ